MSERKEKCLCKIADESYESCEIDQVCLGGVGCKVECDEGKFVDCGCGKEGEGYELCFENQVCVEGECKSKCEEGQGGDCVCGKQDGKYEICQGNKVCKGGECKDKVEDKCVDKSCSRGQVCVEGECKSKCTEGEVVQGESCGCGREGEGYRLCAEGEVCEGSECKGACENGKVVKDKACLCGKKICGKDNVCVGEKCVAKCDDKSGSDTKECGCKNIEGNYEKCGIGNVCLKDVGCKVECKDREVVQGDCGCKGNDGYKLCQAGEVCEGGECKGACESGKEVKDKACFCGKGSCEVGKVCDSKEKCVRKCDKREYVKDENDVCGCEKVQKGNDVAGYATCLQGDICGDGGCLSCGKSGDSSQTTGVRRVCALHEGKLKLMECKTGSSAWEEKEVCDSEKEACADTWGCVTSCGKDDNCKKNKRGNKCRGSNNNLPSSIVKALQQAVFIDDGGNVKIDSINSICICGGSLGCRVGSECKGKNENQMRCEIEGSEGQDPKKVCRADEGINKILFENSEKEVCSCSGGGNEMCKIGEVCKVNQCVKVKQ